jgi:hypothetical protein
MQPARTSVRREAAPAAARQQRDWDCEIHCDASEMPLRCWLLVQRTQALLRNPRKPQKTSGLPVSRAWKCSIGCPSVADDRQVRGLRGQRGDMLAAIIFPRLLMVIGL